MFQIDLSMVEVYFYRFLSCVGLFFIGCCAIYYIVKGADVPDFTFVLLIALSMLIENRIFHFIFEIGKDDNF